MDSDFCFETELSFTAKMVYSVLLERAFLSQANSEDWIDKDGRVFIKFSIANLAQTIRRGTTVVKKALGELDSAGLIERKRNFSAPSTIYVKLPEGRKSVQQSVGKPTHEQSEKRPIDSRNTELMMVGFPSTKNKNTETRLNNTREKKPPRQKYGSYGNVLLTTEEYQKLHKDIPNVDSLIEQLSTYMESKGKRYKNHAATLRNWAARDKSRQKPPRSGGIPDYSYKEGESL